MRTFVINRDKLEQLYVKERRTTTEIARLVGCSRPTVTKELKRYGIPLTRPFAEKYTGNGIDCNTQGHDCSYKNNRAGILNGTCNYSEITGRCRICDPHNCTKYISDKIPKID